MTADLDRLPEPLRNGHLDVESLIAAATPPEKSVVLCLKGDKVAEWEELKARRDQVVQDGGAKAASVGELSEAARITMRMDELRAEMLAYEVTFTLRALTPLAWANLRSAIPGEDDLKEKSPQERAEIEFEWDCRAIARCLVKPEMDEDQVTRLCERLSTQQRSELFAAAWAVNTGKTTVPFDYAASAYLPQSDAT